jgi:hypothetical protein
MMRMKLYLPLLIMLLIVPALSTGDPIDKVASLIRQGNVHGLSAMFAENVEVSIIGDQNVYSKVQARLILDNFFSQNKPKSVKMLHKVNSNPNYQFGALMLDTDKGAYRVTFTLMENNGDMRLIEFGIEADKVR